MTCLNDNGIYHFNIYPENLFIGKIGSQFMIKVVGFAHSTQTVLLLS